MQNLLGFAVTGKVKHDDAPGAAAMFCQLTKDLPSLSIKILDRRSLPFYLYFQFIFAPCANKYSAIFLCLYVLAIRKGVVPNSFL